MEYLLDYASPETRLLGEELIRSRLERMDGRQRATASKILEQVRAGRRDVYV
jgi:2-iminoacetate synthase